MYLVLLCIVLLAFALRVYRLDFFSLRGDESFTVLFVQKPFAQMWHETLTVEPNPPLLYLVLRGWIALAGDSEFVTRFFSVVFGVLCVPLTFRVARNVLTGLTGNRESAEIGANKNMLGITAAFVVAINPYQIWHSQDVRNYTMWAALSLLALMFFWQWYAVEPKHFAERTLQSRRSRAQNALPLLGFIVAELAALYAHYYEAFILLALNLFVFATLWRERNKVLEWIGAQIVLAILYLPYPLILSNRVSSYGEGSGRQGVALWDIARETFSAFVLSDTLGENLRTWLWIPFALLVVAGLIFLWTRDWKRGLFFVVYLAVPTLCLFGLNTIRPLYLERYLNGIAPVYYVLLAFGIVAVSRFSFRDARERLLRERVVVAALLIPLLVIAYLALANYWMNPAYAKAPDWRGLARIINTNAQRGDLIVQNFPETSLLYYDKSKLPLVVYPETFLPDGETERQLNAMNANYQRVWFIPAAPDFWDPEQVVEQWLNRKADLLDEWRAGDFNLHLYSTPSYYLGAMRPTNLTFRNLLALRGYRTQIRGNELRIVFYWRALVKPDKAYTLKLQTLDADGNVLAEETRMPVRDAYPMTLWRKNELVVDQHTLPYSAAVNTFTVSLCDGDLCQSSSGRLSIPTGN